MKKKFLFIVVLVCCLVLVSWITMGTVKSCSEYNAREDEKIAARKAEYDSLILTEKEMDYWIAVYTAAVKRGVWYPAERANAAIIELRKKSEGAE